MLGNLLIVGLTTTDEEILKKLILECHVGGVTLYSKNYRTYQDMITLINKIRCLSREAKYDILICIDQEGYRVNRLPKDIHNLNSPYSFHTNPLCIQEYAFITGSILKASGIHLNFAPVLDIKRFPDNHPIGDRSFGDNPTTVSKNGQIYYQTLKETGIIPVVKHFPGHGATSFNSHHFLPIIFNKKRLFKEDIIPFKDAIDNQIDAIMIGHLIVPSFSLTPASLSSKVVAYLESNMHFKGVIITDDLDMGVLKFIPKSLLFKRAINSGANLITVKYTDSFFKDYQKLITMYQKNKVKKENVLNSLDKLDKMKKKYKVNNKPITSDLDIVEHNERIDALNHKDLS